jgi:hypothetical protein
MILDTVKESTKVVLKGLPRGERFKFTEEGIKHWFNHQPENVKNQIKKIILISQGIVYDNKSFKYPEYFDLIYPAGSFMVKEGWGKEMWLLKGEYKLFIVRGPGEWL